MPILNKFRIRTPLDEFENYLGEEMNTFAGFFIEESPKETEIVNASEGPIQEENKGQIIPQSFWTRLMNKIFKFSSDLFF